LAFRKNNPPASALREATSAELRALSGRARNAVTDGVRHARNALSRGTEHPLTRSARDAVIRGVQQPLTRSAHDAVLRGVQHPATRGARDAVSRGARHVADQSARTARDPSRRWKAGVVAVVAIGTVAGVGASAPWAGASQPTTIYDSINPAAIPAGQTVATYADGAYQVSSASVSGRGNVLWIDTNGSDTHADALDVEPGDVTPAGAAQWVSAKLSASPHADAIIYTLKNEWGSVQDSISTLPSWMQSHVKYWIADPTGTPHILPGASATQWYWGSSYDISQTQPGFFN
jgi:hypothetical protein